MPSAIKLRTDFTARELRRLAKKAKDVNRSRRLLSLAAVLNGMSRSAMTRLRSIRRQRTTPSTSLSGPISTILVSSAFWAADSRAVGPLAQLSHISARPRHPAQDAEIVAAYKKTLRAG